MLAILPAEIRARRAYRSARRSGAQPHASLERAKWAQNRLVELGVGASRIAVVGIGAERPRETGDGDAAVASNRRVEVRWILGDSPGRRRGQVTHGRARSTLGLVNYRCRWLRRDRLFHGVEPHLTRGRGPSGCARERRRRAGGARGARARRTGRGRARRAAAAALREDGPPPAAPEPEIEPIPQSRTKTLPPPDIIRTEGSSRSEKPGAYASVAPPSSKRSAPPNKAEHYYQVEALRIELRAEVVARHTVEARAKELESRLSSMSQQNRALRARATDSSATKQPAQRASVAPAAANPRA